MTQVLLVAGARADVLRLAPILRALRATPDFAPALVHAGHAADLPPAFLAELDSPAPDRHLGVAGDDPRAMARILVACEALLLADKPDLVLVAGGQAAAFAAALAAVKLRIPVAHVGAGLRGGRAQPEELNRRLIERIAAWLFTSSPEAEQRLLADGHPRDRIHPVGSVLIDAVLHAQNPAGRSPIPTALGVEPRSYAVLSLDRPVTMTSPALAAALGTIRGVAAELQILCPIDPRIRAGLPGLDGVRILDQLGYRDALPLLADARLVLTDSQDIQEMASAFQVPCLALSPALDPERITDETRRILRAPATSSGRPAGDGKAAERIVAVLSAGVPAWSLEEALPE